ncbi:hypothetical protein [Sphingomonas carotinifaciens]|uniref:hypothetical protein n=1 Tax=Sphingomonas carotinifaciens TaxID=1166323 RepID=UPI001237594C|nr:hypothetical protein [Sphingomonas carotinifaciens]
MTPWIWPPQCCVPAFVHAALVQLGVDCPYPEAIPGILGVRVRADQSNPLGLALADASHPAGIRGADAEREVNRMCRELDSPLRLRRVPFKTIVEELWMDVLDDAMSRGAVVGLGIDYNVLMGTVASDRSAQHVMRVLVRDGESIAIFDDSGESVPAMISVDPARVRAAVLPIDDGLWIMNRGSELNFAHTLPWRD